MPKFEITLNYKKIITASDEMEAIENFWENIDFQNQGDLTSFLEQITTIKRRGK